MTIRPARPEDAAPLAALSIEVWLGTYLKDGISPFFANYVLAEYTTANVADRLADPANTIFVSENSVGPTGYICLTTNRPCPVAGGPTSEITTLYLQPRHHGKGIGRDLLSAALTTCQDRNIPNLWLATNAENHPAIGFYQANGFRIIGETAFQIDDASYPNVVLARDI